MIIFLRLIWKYNHKILKFIFAVKRNAKKKEYHFISSLNCTVCESFPSFCHVVLYSFNFSTLFIFFRFIFFLYSSTQLVFAFNYLSIHFFRWYHFCVLFFVRFYKSAHMHSQKIYIYSVALQIHSKHARLQALSL